MKRINIFTPYPSDGTSFYRAWGVFNQIVQRESLPIHLEANNVNTWADIGKYQLLFCHRPHDTSHLNFIVTAKNMNIPVWVDWDDMLDAVPSTNPAYKMYKDTSLNEILSKSDVITCSTQFMANQYNGQVIENFIPLKLQYREPVKRDKFRIVWRGSNTHEKDWMVHLPKVVEFLKDKKDVQFIVLGDMPVFALHTIIHYVDVRKIEGMNTLPYFQALQNTELGDLLFVPLEDIPFNRAKSDCSTREALVNGMLSLSPEWNNNDVFAYGDVTEKRLKVLEERGDLEFEADTIRTNIDAAISRRQKELNSKEQQNIEYSRNFATKLNTNIETTLSKTENLLGFKVGKDDADIQKWREKTAKYFSTGEFTRSLDAMLKGAHDDADKAVQLLELAQFMRSREGIFKGLMQKGKSEKAKEILNELENTSTERPQGERKADKKTATGWFSDPSIRQEAGLD